MDKKNTMLLTVIAVATLLVAVVGATFAYFSVSATTNSSSAAVTTKAQAVGTVAVANTNALYLNLTADQMAETLAGSKYYAQATNIASSTEVAAPVAVATFTAEDVADTDVTYTCTFNYTISNETDADANAVAVLTNDGVVTLTTSSDKLTLTSTSYKLGGSQSGTGELIITDNSTATISAVAYLENTDEPQDGLAGKSVTTTFAISDFACDTTTAQ